MPLFAASGCAALVYEVVWLHLLRLTIGVSTYSLGVVLAAFMGGMALGSLAYASLVSRDRHPLRVYAVLEWGIGVFGLAMPYLLPVVGGLYFSGMKWHGGSIVMRALVAGTVLLPPTVLMGATLPAISRCVRSDPRGAAWLGWFYGANLVGAVCGSLFAGLVLMHYFDAQVASFTAAGINGLVGLGAWTLASIIPASDELVGQGSDAATPTAVAPAPGSSVPLVIAAVVLFCSGAAALGAEVVWTRLLTLTFGPTVYAFALVLAVFLAGLGIGSAVSSVLLPKLRRPLLGLCFCQLALLLTIPLAATSFADESLKWASAWMMPAITKWPTTLRDLVRCVMTVLPSSLLWGASFPLGVGAAIAGRSDPARTVGYLSASNTAGAIVGALGTAFVLVPWLGTQMSQRALVIAATMAAGCCAVWHIGTERDAAAGNGRPRWVSAVCLAAMFALGALGILRIAPPSPALFAFGREAPKYRDAAPMLVVQEGVHTPIVVTKWPQFDNMRALHLDGKLVASDERIDLRVERMLGHVPQYLIDQPRSVLIVGLGTGITAGSFVMDERTERIVICELEPKLPPITDRIFGDANRHVLDDPRTELVIDDARHFLQTTDERFDIITVDPIHPWVRGAAALYSVEFFEQCRRHLNPGGVVSYWVPMQSMTAESVKSELASFFEVFPHGTVWHTGGTSRQRHMMVVGTNEPQRIDLQQVDRLTPAGGPIDVSLHEMGFQTPDEMLALYVADGEDLNEWMADAEINRDWSLRLEYLAGAAAYRNEREAIYKQVVAHRTWPEGLFIGDGERLEAIRQQMQHFDALEAD